MMKKIFLIILLISNYIYSQNSIEVEYAFNENASIYKSKLVYTDSISLFTIYDTKIKEKGNDVVNIEKGISIKSFKPKSQNRILIQSNSDSLIYYNLNLGKKFYTVKEPKIKLNWTLQRETKTILNFKCNSAKVKFNNKEYIAYYTTEIPINGGPWKYRGLPGLILELKSLDNKIHFRASSIKKERHIDRKDFSFKENELAKNLNNIEDLKSHPKLEKFINSNRYLKKSFLLNSTYYLKN